MKLVIYTIFLLGVVSISSAAEVSGFFQDPAYPGKCVYDSLILSPGEEGKIPKTCGVILCGDDSFATIQTCGVKLPPPGCKYTDYLDINAPYPDCCDKKLICIRKKY